MTLDPSWAPRPPRSSRRLSVVLASIGIVAAAIVVLVVGVTVANVRSADDASPSPTSPPTPTVTVTATASPAPSSPGAPVVSPAAQPCDKATTLTIWAHPDDDIIFANPTISTAIAAGECVRTVFVTAGDAGKGMEYVRSRELGIRQAYDHMRGSAQGWDTEQLSLLSGVHVTRETPKDDPRISLTFFHLPDGNITGSGFPSTGDATITKLVDGQIPAIAPIDGGPAVTTAALESSLTEIATALQPSHVLTHIPRGSAFAPGDHPDHSTVGALVRATVGKIASVAPGIRYFVGYPSINLPANVTGQALQAKVDTYRVYAHEDEVVRCANNTACLATKKFGQWLQRSYPKTDAELQMK